jgi:hypothetical protein
MLTDTMEKSKNPLKRAMRRRNAKQVSFTDPTYVEPSDYGYSSDEDEDADSFTNPDATQEQNGTDAALENDEDDISAVAPLNIRSAKEPQVADKESLASPEDDDQRDAVDRPRSSEDSSDRTCKFLPFRSMTKLTCFQLALDDQETGLCETQTRSSRTIPSRQGRLLLHQTYFVTIPTRPTLVPPSSSRNVVLASRACIQTEPTKVKKTRRRRKRRACSADSLNERIEKAKAVKEIFQVLQRRPQICRGTRRSNILGRRRQRRRVCSWRAAVKSFKGRAAKVNYKSLRLESLRNDRKCRPPTSGPPCCLRTCHYKTGRVQIWFKMLPLRRHLVQSRHRSRTYLLCVDRSYSPLSSNQR